MIVRVKALGRSVPTPVAYKVERLESTEYEFEVEATRNVGDVKDLDLIIGVYRDRQMAELNALEARVLAPYSRQPAPERQAPYEAGPLATGAKPIMPALLTADTRHELRRLALELTNAGGTAPAGVPVTETEGQTLAKQLADAIHALRPPEPEPAPAAAIPAGKRTCSSGKHGREPRILESRVYDFSVDRYGKPLCRECQQTATPIRGRNG